MAAGEGMASKFVLNGVVARMVSWWFMDDVVVHCKDAWNLYQVPASQVDAMLTELTLIHQHVRCVVNPEFYGDEVKEEVRLLIMGRNVVMEITCCVVMFVKGVLVGDRGDGCQAIYSSGACARL